jgi:hypothetical protein
MIEKTVLFLVALFAVYWALRIKKLLPAIITFGMVMGVMLAVGLPGFSKTISTGLLVYMFFAAFAFVYAFIAKGKTWVERIILALLSLSVFLHWLWILNHWHGNELLAPMLTLLVALFAVFTRANLRNELGFVLILVVDAILIIFAAWMKAC